MIAIHHTLFAACLFVPSTAPDIIPDGVRGVRVEATIDAKALAATHCLAHVVQKGDTLTKIATTVYGDTSRVAAIAKLNPLTEPDRLRIGEVLWLPPRDAAAAAKEPVFAYLDTGRPIHSEAKPLVDGAAVTPSRYGGIGLWLVPLGAREAFRAALAEHGASGRARNGKPLEELVAAGTVVDVNGQGLSRYVAIGDPTHRRVDTYTVTKAADGKFTLTATSVAYDKDGNVLPGAERPKSDPAKEGLVLLLLGATGAALLLRRAQALRLPALA